MEKLGRNDLCWCGSGVKYKKCHEEFDHKLAGFAEKGIEIPSREMIKNEVQIQGIRESGVVNSAVLDYVAARIKPGLSTEEINEMVHERTVALGGWPAPLEYEGFPKSVCTSLNAQVCHGIPSDGVILQEGDIINVDVSTEYNGYFSDSSRMFCIGQVAPPVKRLVDIAKDCMQAGVDEVQPWKRLGNVGQAIYAHALRHGFSVVLEIGGHGVGIEFHEDPWVSHVAKKDTGILMAPGMVFTIEPMINMGGREIFTDELDGWTVYTADGKPSAQWEVTVLVTETGYEILSW